MPTVIDTAGLDVGRLQRPRRTPLKRYRQAFWPRLVEAHKNWRIDSHYRRVLLYYCGFFWILGWSAWVLLTAPLPILRWPLTLLSFLVVAGALLVLWLAFDQRKTSLWVVVTALLQFMVFVGAVAVLLRPYFNQVGLLWAWGTLLIYLIGAVALVIPMWQVNMKPGEIFLIEDKRVKPEGFRLVKRPPPQIDAALREAVIRAGVPPMRVDKFLDYGGPTFMRQELETLAGEKNLPTLQTFFEHVAQNQPKDTTLAASAVQQFRLVWNTADFIKIGPLTIDHLITHEGNTVAIELTFTGDYSPYAIREPAAYLKLPDWEAIEAMKTALANVLADQAHSIAQHYFVEIPLQSALTDGSIRKFCGRLEEKLAWTRDALGITVSANKVLCHPIIPPAVQQAETQMLAARPNAQAETARLQALLEQVFKYRVPPKLLAGLMMADRGTERTVQSTFDDMLDLPDPDEFQRRIYAEQKYNDQLPKHQVAEVPPPRRRSLNIGEELLRQMGKNAEDAEFRPLDDDKK